MPNVTKAYLKDLAERVIATALQAAVSYAIVEVADWSFEWVPILTAALSMVKGVLARWTGDRESASLNKETV